MAYMSEANPPYYEMSELYLIFMYMRDKFRERITRRFAGTKIDDESKSAIRDYILNMLYLPDCLPKECLTVELDPKDPNRVLIYHKPLLIKGSVSFKL